MADTTTTALVVAGKPTAGPLRLKRALLGDVSIVTKDNGIVAEFYTAIDHEFEKRDEEALANARMFLAAADLLAALRDARAFVDEERATVLRSYSDPRTGEIPPRDSAGHRALMRCDARLAQIDAALTKAEGGGA